MNKRVLLAASAAVVALGWAGVAQAVVQTGDLNGLIYLPGALGDPRPQRVTLEADLSDYENRELYVDIYYYFELTFDYGPSQPPVYHIESFHYWDGYSHQITPNGFSFIIDTPDNINCDVYKTGFCGHEYVANFVWEGFTDRPVPYTYRITAIPEPSTWALAVSGFGVAGAMLRRRTRSHGGPSARETAC